MTCKHDKHNSWWEYDARGIPLCRVCDRCRKKQLAQYRPEVLTDGNYEADEDIEPEPEVGPIDRRELDDMIADGDPAVDCFRRPA